MIPPRVVEFPDGYAICGDSTSLDVASLVFKLIGHIPLIIADPPYGNIVNEDWDKFEGDAKAFCAKMVQWTQLWSVLLLQGGAFYVWGGIGTPGFRPFLRYLYEVETPGFRLSTLITWSKKRAYGIQWGYLFTREECAYFVKGDPKKPRMFNVPLLETLRGYKGYKKAVVVGCVSLCYHTQHDEECPCVSPGAQVQGERDVLQLLRQVAVPWAPSGEAAEAQGLGGQEQGPSSGVQKAEKQAKTDQSGFGEVEGERQETKYTICVDGGGSAGSVDGRVPRVRNANNGKRQKGEQLSVGGQDRQLCWVCTREHLRNVLARKSSEAGRDSGGAGTACGLHEGAIYQDVAFTENRLAHPAKSDFLRRTNVWTDITEIFRGKQHIAQKKQRLFEIPIEVHTAPGEWVVDPFAGYGTTAFAARKLGRKFVVIERDETDFNAMVERLQSMSTVAADAIPEPEPQDDGSENNTG